MIKNPLLVLLAISIVGFTACNQSIIETTERSAPKPPVAPGRLPVSMDSSPEVVASAFLDALRAGNNTIAEQFLTSTAREQATSHNLVVQPPGSPSATYEIREVTRRGPNANVNSRWTEFSAEGLPVNYDIVWILKQQSEGWRIAGMATAFIPGAEPVFLNFEDAADLLAKWNQADEDLAAESDKPTAIQAEVPRQSVSR